MSYTPLILLTHGSLYFFMWKVTNKKRFPQALAMASAGVNYHEGAEFVRASLARDQDVIIDFRALQQACPWGLLLISSLSCICLNTRPSLKGCF